MDGSGDNSTRDSQPTCADSELPFNWRSAIDETLRKSSILAITIVDEHGQIVFANPGACEILELSTSSVTQRRFNSPEWRISDWQGQPIADESLPFWQVVRAGRIVRDFRHAIVAPNGRRKLLSIDGQRVLDDQGCFSFICDVYYDRAGETPYRT